MKLEDIKLEFYKVSGGELGIRAVLGKEFNCIEYVISGSKPQTILYDPYIQFEPKELSDIRETIAKKLVELWNKSNEKKNQC